VIVSARFGRNRALRAGKGVLQSIKGVISVKAGEIEELRFHNAAVMRSHDFH
jgi:hypothetical protein